MTTGKPDFNLNSFGIKYLTKDEVQEFLEKYEIPTGADQAALRTERAKQLVQLDHNLCPEKILLQNHIMQDR